MFTVHKQNMFMNHICTVYKNSLVKLSMILPSQNAPIQTVTLAASYTSTQNTSTEAVIILEETEEKAFSFPDINHWRPADVADQLTRHYSRQSMSTHCSTKTFQLTLQSPPALALQASIPCLSAAVLSMQTTLVIHKLNQQYEFPEILSLSFTNSKRVRCLTDSCLKYIYG